MELTDQQLIVPAVFSSCHQYRYMLRRRVGFGEQRCLFIMLNPSTATEKMDDPTIRRCIRFARSWGYGWLDVGNLFAYRTTNPNLLDQPNFDPIGSENDAYLVEMARIADTTVVAWGNGGKLHNRGNQVRELLADVQLSCLGLTRQGEPRHPLYLPYREPLIPL